MVEVELSQNLIALVDDADAPLILPFKWSATKGYNTMYACRRTGSIILLLHRVIMGVSSPIIQVDHRDGDGLNNLRSNLRTCNNSQNNQNKPKYKNNKSGFKGVSFDARMGFWRANIYVNKKQTFLGHFKSPEKAHEAYCDAAIKYFGEFARLT